MATSTPIAISARWLLWIYVVVPLTLLGAAVDRLWLNGALRLDVFRDQGDFALYHLVAGTPHILASSVILFGNRDYVRLYGRRVAITTVLIVLFLVLAGLFLPFNAIFAIVGVATVLHVLRQQVGIGRGICRQFSPWYEAWGWITVALGAILYNALYLGSELPPELRTLTRISLWGLGGLLLLTSIICQAKLKSRLGRLYLWANAFMTGASIYLFATGYPFLAVIAPRLIHDLTAFSFYCVHDYNRHHAAPKNAVCRALQPLGRGLLLVSPATAILVTLMLRPVADPLAVAATDALFGVSVPHAISFYFLLYLTLLHYYTEALTWRRGSPYRQYISMRI